MAWVIKEKDLLHIHQHDVDAERRSGVARDRSPDPKHAKP
jgi:hypothetical protein